jgi:hypothetical protein
MEVPADASRRKVHSLCIFAGSEKIYTVEKMACAQKIRMPGKLCHPFHKRINFYDCSDFGRCFDGMSFEKTRSMASNRSLAPSSIGAGDAFFSLSAPLVASGCDPFLAGFIGNAVGAMKIRIVGHRHYITRAEVVKYLTSLLK